MEWEHKSELFNYIQLILNKKEVEIINYLIVNDPDINAELYYNNETYFLFNKNKKTTVQELLEYLYYIFDHPYIIPKMRKEKIDKIKKGS